MVVTLNFMLDNFKISLFGVKSWALFLILSLKPSFWGVEPPKPPAHQFFGGMLTRGCSYTCTNSRITDRAVILMVRWEVFVLGSQSRNQVALLSLCDNLYSSDRSLCLCGSFHSLAGNTVSQNTFYPPNLRSKVCTKLTSLLLRHQKPTGIRRSDHL